MTEMTGLLIVVSIWCGQPINSTKGMTGFKTGSNISIDQVNSCRERLWKCVVPAIGKGVAECFIKEKL